MKPASTASRLRPASRPAAASATTSPASHQPPTSQPPASHQPPTANHRPQEACKALHRELMYDGVRVDSIHADQSQAARAAAVDNFRCGRAARSAFLFRLYNSSVGWLDDGVWVGVMAAQGGVLTPDHTPSRLVPRHCPPCPPRPLSCPPRPPRPPPHPPTAQHPHLPTSPTTLTALHRPPHPPPRPMPAAQGVQVVGAGGDGPDRPGHGLCRGQHRGQL